MSIKDLKKEVGEVGKKAERNRVMIEGVDGDNGLKSALTKVDGKIDTANKDLNNIGMAYRKLDKKLSIIIAFLIGAGVFEGIIKVAGTF